MRLANGAGVLQLEPRGGRIEARLWLEHKLDRAEALERIRRLLDLDADPLAVVAALGSDPLIGKYVMARPGLRVPGTVDPHELAVRAVLGQQVSVAGARSLAGRLVTEYGSALSHPVGSVSRLFPSVEALTRADPAELGMPAPRGRALTALARALSTGELILDPNAVQQTRKKLISLPGIGPWTADYIAMRGLDDRDTFLPGDLGIRRALELLGRDGRPAAAAKLAERWRPYRAYAFQHLLAVNIPPAG